MEEQLEVKNIATALFCQRKLYYEQKLGKKEDIKKQILREALIYTNRAEMGIIQDIKDYEPKEDVQNRYYDSGRRSLQEALLNNLDALREQKISIIESNQELWEDLKPYIKTRINNAFTFMHKNKVYGNELWWELLPKISYNLLLSSEKLELTMNIDRVDNYKTQAIPYLYKKQNAPEKGLWHNHRYELVAAMILLAEQGLIIQEGVIAYENGKTERTLELTPELEEQLKEAILITKTLLAEQRLPSRTENINKCEHCSYKEACYSEQNQHFIIPTNL